MTCAFRYVVDRMVDAKVLHSRHKHLLIVNLIVLCIMDMFVSLELCKIF